MHVAKSCRYMNVFAALYSAFSIIFVEEVYCIGEVRGMCFCAFSSRFYCTIQMGLLLKKGNTDNCQLFRADSG